MTKVSVPVWDELRTVFTNHPFKHNSCSFLSFRSEATACFIAQNKIPDRNFFYYGNSVLSLLLTVLRLKKLHVKFLSSNTMLHHFHPHSYIQECHRGCFPFQGSKLLLFLILSKQQSLSPSVFMQELPHLDDHSCPINNYSRLTLL